MNQSQIYENLIDLFSDNDDVRLRALLAKKDWVLNRFYLPFTFVSCPKEGDYTDLESLMKQALVFHKLSQPRLANIEQISLIKAFNKQYSYLKLYESLPTRPNENTFFIEVDFRKLDKDDYKTLLPAFFYCLNKNYFKLNHNERIGAFLSAMIGTEDEAVLIVKDCKLEKNILRIDGMTKIYIYDDITEKENAILEKIAKYTGLKVVIVHA